MHERIGSTGRRGTRRHGAGHRNVGRRGNAWQPARSTCGEQHDQDAKCRRCKLYANRPRTADGARLKDAASAPAAVDELFPDLYFFVYRR